MSFERRLDDESRAADSTEKKVHRLKHKKRNLFFEKRPFILSDWVGKDAISFSFLKEDSKGALSLKCLPPGLVTPILKYFRAMILSLNNQRNFFWLVTTG